LENGGDESLKAVVQFCLVVLLMLSGQAPRDLSGTSGPESIEMRAVVLSECPQPNQPQHRRDLLPVQFVYARIQRIGDKVTAQYWRFDEAYKRVSIGSEDWSTDQLGRAIGKLKSTGARDRDFIAPSESSGEDLPVSFLKVRSAGFNFDAYTMWLRFRWAGEMKTDNPLTTNVLDAWKSLLQQATPERPTQSGIEAIRNIAGNCAEGWPPDIKGWVCEAAQHIAHH
jgi:hypothetical protein